jgi:hypothetical protein
VADTAASRCDCCDLPASSCGKAVEAARAAADRQERRRLLDLPGVFHARWPGSCAGCGERFAVDDPIRRFSKVIAEGYLGPCCVEAKVR